MRHLYTFIFYLLTPLLLLRLWLRARKCQLILNVGASVLASFLLARLSARPFGLCRVVGETLAALLMLRELLSRYPMDDLVITTTANGVGAGSAFAEEIRQDECFMSMRLMICRVPWGASWGAHNRGWRSLWKPSWA